MSQKIKVIRPVKAGYIIKILKTNQSQVIPTSLLLNRIKWGLYIMINPEMITEL